MTENSERYESEASPQSVRERGKPVARCPECRWESGREPGWAVSLEDLRAEYDRHWLIWHRHPQPIIEWVDAGGKPIPRSEPATVTDNAAARA